MCCVSAAHAGREAATAAATDVPIKVRRFMPRIVLPKAKVDSKKVRDPDEGKSGFAGSCLANSIAIQKKEASAGADASFLGVVFS
jgi:hypothetical protein